MVSTDQHKEREPIQSWSQLASPDSSVSVESLQLLLNHTDALNQSRPDLLNVELETTLDLHLRGRQLEGAKFLPGEKIMPPYKDPNQGGTFVVGHHHLREMIAGYQTPSEELLERLKERPKESYGTMPPLEAGIIIEAVRALQPRTYFEIGTNQGYLSKELIDAGPDDLIGFTLDLPPERHNELSVPLNDNNRRYVKDVNDDTFAAQIQDSRDPSRVIQLLGDSHNFDYTPFKGRMDVVIVDGNHRLEAVYEDLKTAAELVSPGGIIFVDDYAKMALNSDVTAGVLLFSRLHEKRFYHTEFSPQFAPDPSDGIEGCCLAFYVNDSREHAAPKQDGLESRFAARLIQDVADSVNLID